MNRKIFILAILYFLGLKAIAQADISMATHWYNRASYNPASIARPDFIYFFTNARKQWTGINNSPTVFNIQASAYYDDLKSGFGFSMLNDNVGLTQVFNPSLLYAHVIGIGKDLHLSMGLSAGVFVRTLKASEFEAEIIMDPALIYTDQLKINPDANLGFELQAKHVIIGISTTHLFSITRPDDNFLNTNQRYGYIFYRNSDSELFNIQVGTQVSNRYNLTVFEGHSMIRFKHPSGFVNGPKELFDVGATWRSTKQLTLLFGINVSRDLRVGYAYDYDFVLHKDKKGTHEFILEYRIPVHSKHSVSGTYWYF